MGLVELFCGIGGVAEAARQLDPIQLRSDLKTLRAIDIDRDCGRVYELNFGSKVDCQTIESLDFDELAGQGDGLDLWWLSPPCQPYCRRGRGQSETDHRCSALLAMIAWLRSGPDRLPDRIVLENVPEFSDSSHGHQLDDALAENGFATTHTVLCPTQFGIPNRRRRFYLMASRKGHASMVLPSEAAMKFAVPDVLESSPEPTSELWLAPNVASAYADALDVVDADDPSAITACFASGYGKSIIRSGSYVRQHGNVRRFSPVEVVRLLGFSDTFVFPADFSVRKQWKMLGNSLSIPVVKAVLTSMSAEL